MDIVQLFETGLSGNCESLKSILAAIKSGRIRDGDDVSSVDSSRVDVIPSSSSTNADESRSASKDFFVVISGYVRDLLIIAWKLRPYVPNPNGDDADPYNPSSSTLVSSSGGAGANLANTFIDWTHEIYSSFVRLPEFNDDSKCIEALFSDTLGIEAITRSYTFPREDEQNILVEIIKAVYCLNPSSRPSLRNALAKVLERMLAVTDDQYIGSTSSALSAMTSADASNAYNSSSSIGQKQVYDDPRTVVIGGKVALRIICHIVEGMKPPLSVHNIKLLSNMLMPLHMLPGKITHLKPLLSLIHEFLCFCCVQYLQKDVDQTLPIIVKGVVSAWPSPWAGNTPKEVLLIHELEQIMEESVIFISNKKNVQIRESIIGRIVACVSSDHSAVCERALQLWANTKVEKLLSSAPFRGELLPSLTAPLLESAISHWNETVRKMSKNVIRTFAQTNRAVTTENEDIFVIAVKKGKYSDIATAKKEIELLIQLPKAESQDIRIPSQHGATVSISSTSTSNNELLSMTVQDTVREKDLGHGSFGVVYRALRIVKGKPRSEWPFYAIKAVPIEHKNVALREIEMMRAVKHENSLNIVSFYECSKEIHIVMELADYGDLHDLLVKTAMNSENEGFGIEENVCKVIGAQIGSALGAVHAIGLVYGDLKPENILIFKGGVCKLGDFGAARRVKEDCGPGAPMEGTLIYLAPEVLSGKSPSIAMDWWAFGCLLFQILSGRQPVSGWEAEELGKKTEKGNESNDVEAIASGIVKFEVSNFPRTFPTNAVQAKDIIKKLMTNQPENRLGSNGDASEVEKHPYWEGYGFAAQKNKTKLVADFVAKVLELDAIAAKAGLGKNKKNLSSWTQRSYSMVLSPLPGKYNFESLNNQKAGENSFKWLPTTISENEKEKNMSWITSNSSRASLQFAPSLASVISETEESNMESKEKRWQKKLANFILTPPIDSTTGSGASSLTSGKKITGIRTNAVTSLTGTSMPKGNAGKYTFKGIDFTAG